LKPSKLAASTDSNPQMSDSDQQAADLLLGDTADLDELCMDVFETKITV